ncbi:MAG: hypothetical protein WB762_30655 [Candidatus Sulfotelmatobacter sp.]
MSNTVSCIPGSTTTNFFPAIFSRIWPAQPDVNFEVGSGSHAAQTAEIMKRIEPVRLDYRSEMVLVVGDVNSTRQRDDRLPAPTSRIG